MRIARRGFTLIEMLIALVLLAIVAEVLVSAGQQVTPGQVLVRFAAPAKPVDSKEVNP